MRLQQFRSVVAGSFEARLGFMVVVLALIGGAVLINIMPETDRSILALKLTYFAGKVFAIALAASLVAGVVGWLAYSKRAFIWTFVASFLLIAAGLISRGGNFG